MGKSLLLAYLLVGPPRRVNSWQNVDATGIGLSQHCLCRPNVSAQPARQALTVDQELASDHSFLSGCGTEILTLAAFRGFLLQHQPLGPGAPILEDAERGYRFAAKL
jgi:hypothetical protein